MTIGAVLPKHLEVAAKTGALSSPVNDQMDYRRVALEIDLTAKSQTLVDLGGMPVPTRNSKQVDTLIEKTIDVEPVDWYLTLHVDQNDIDDDQTGTVERNFQNLMPAFQRHINSLVFTYLDAGDGTTYGVSVTGLSLFNDSQIYKSASYNTAQDNLYALDLGLANFNTVWAAARGFRDDQGNYSRYTYNLLVCNQNNNVIAANITGNPSDYSTGNRANNPYSGQVDYITVPEMGTSSWVLVASTEPTKPLVVAIRKRPALLDTKFDSQAGRGGRWYFIYHGRYTVAYGDPLLAIMGKT